MCGSELSKGRKEADPQGRWQYGPRPWSGREHTMCEGVTKTTVWNRGTLDEAREVDENQIILGLT